MRWATVLVVLAFAGCKKPSKPVPIPMTGDAGPAFGPPVASGAGRAVGIDRVCASNQGVLPKWQLGAPSAVSVGDHRSRIAHHNPRRITNDYLWIAEDGTAMMNVWYEDESPAKTRLDPWAGFMKWKGTWHALGNCTTVVLDPTEGPAKPIVLACSESPVVTETRKSDRAILCLAEEPAIYTFRGLTAPGPWILFGENKIYREPTVGDGYDDFGERMFGAGDP